MRRTPFSEEWVRITKQEDIERRHRVRYLEAQNARASSRIEGLKQEIALKDAKIKDLQNRLFGKKSEKHSRLKSEKGDKADPPSRRNRGQQPGRRGHGRTQRPDLPVVHDVIDLADAEKCCPTCGLAYGREAALDEHSEVIEV